VKHEGDDNTIKGRGSRVMTRYVPSGNRGEGGEREEEKEERWKAERGKGK